MEAAAALTDNSLSELSGFCDLQDEIIYLVLNVAYEKFLQLRENFVLKVNL